MNDPLEYSKFAADAEDIDYQCNRSIRFEIRKSGTTILEETYTPDNDSYVHVRGLAGILSQCLYGTLGATDQTPTAKDTFTFHVNGASLFGNKEIYAMRLRNPADPNGRKKVMAVAAHSTAHAGTPMLVTVIGFLPTYLYRSDGSVLSARSIGSADSVTTVDIDPATLYPDTYRDGSHIDIGGEMCVDILPPLCSNDAVAVRFLNRYDMPESLVAAYLEEKPQAQGDTAVMYGRRTRFDVKSSTEYTLKSGPVRHREQFDTWQDLLTSRKAQVLWHGQWTDIIVTKANYTRHRRNFYGQQVEMAFQTANPLLTL